MVQPSAALIVLRESDYWPSAIANLTELCGRQGGAARVEAAKYAEVYAGRRGSMVVDVVASRQRKYSGRVLKIVERWESAAPDTSLRTLADTGIDAPTYGLQEAEADTIQAVAKNLARYGSDSGWNEDETCKIWADRCEGVEHAPRLDPVVGSVKGIGPALFAYMRMRSGASAIKADIRVKKSLRGLGFGVPDSDSATMVIAHAAAEEMDMDLLVLDQLLWHANGSTNSSIGEQS
ncbi:hypothetical protein ACN9MI_07815 [Rhodococcoides fascians]|jgi:hypothetical protein|uniref:hypothetical protein n=1 Tax=Rhodococcoides fascians TaxID=1828 RepID=UPI0012D2A45D|nr:hypothetical protein [Rhodococcus fascians]WQH30005.1 hypothetical protein U2G91_08770 [Rhodococcus fascians]